MMTLNLITNHTGEFACEVAGMDAYVIGERTASAGRYLYTPIDRRVWLDCGGSRCSDLGQLSRDIPAPAGDSRQEAFEEWAAAICALAHDSGVRIES